MSKQNTIKLNGKLFDATTGKPLSSTTSSHHAIIKPTVKHNQSKLLYTSKHQKHREPHHPHDTHRKTEHAKTLMRHSVKKPAHIAHKISDLQPKSPASYNIDLATNLDILGAKHNRTKHAASITKSHLVHRFAARDDLIPTVVKRLTKLSVKPAPGDPTIEKHNFAPVAGNISDDIFSNALAIADSHAQKLHKQSRRHRAAKKLGVKVSTVHFGISLIVIVALGGFVLYQNAANIRVRLAAADAGVHASLPGYSPAGFALDNSIQTTPGKVILSYRSNSDSRNFKITQTAVFSGVQSTTLAANSGQSSQVITGTNGATIYIYGDASASWINGNTLYTIEGDSSLSTSQLLKIANSL